MPEPEGSVSVEPGAPVTGEAVPTPPFKSKAIVTFEVDCHIAYNSRPDPKPYISAFVKVVPLPSGSVFQSRNV
jgi:hypothetical protein